MSKRSVLVVEDEFLIRMALADGLEEAGYEVIEAANASQALAALGGRDRIQAVVTDVDMPGPLDGFALLRVAAGMEGDRAMIVTSGKHAADCGRMVEGSTFISKPYDIADILAALELQLAGIVRPKKAAVG